MNNIWIIAQQGSDAVETLEPTRPGEETSETSPLVRQEADPNNGAAADRDKPGWGQLIIVAPLFIVMYLLLFRGPRKQQQKHKQMVQTLSKNDRVRTIGGIIGTVVDIKDDEVVLKIDESNNTKIRVTPGAIGKNLTKEPKE